MRVDVVTLFPELFESFLQASLIGKAVASGLLEVGFSDPRDFATDKHRTVDDAPFGGGEGMVLKAEPLVAAMEAIEARLGGEAPHRLLLTPQGEPLKQAQLEALAKKDHVVIVCGRYEGVDERVRHFVHQEISLGDFVLNGGEVAAMALIDGVARLLPGVIGNARSLLSESHQDGLLEYPQYTRPRVFRQLDVPQILLEGDHGRIDNWRRLQMMLRTRKRRPDLWAAYRPSGEDLSLLRSQGAAPGGARGLASRSYIALLHHPVYDRGGRIVTTAITNLDLHDIARSARTYGLAGYFVVTPLSSQQELATRIMGHWRDGHGARTHEKRREALALVDVAPSLEEVVARVEKKEGKRPLTVATSASAREGQLGRDDLHDWLKGGEPMVILMGTGWGLAQELLDSADLAFKPVTGGTDYNHLSVRSAAAILLDRIFGLRDES